MKTQRLGQGTLASVSTGKKVWEGGPAERQVMPSSQLGRAAVSTSVGYCMGARSQERPEAQAGQARGNQCTMFARLDGSGPRHLVCVCMCEKTQESCCSRMCLWRKLLRPEPF